MRKNNLKEMMKCYKIYLLIHLKVQENNYLLKKRKSKMKKTFFYQQKPY